ncbi:MAG: hypothetical protein JXB49_35135 [Bacteroidales bacterium]|nr:hypothetical protein [Bacteroidales bacterium]
MKKRLFFIIYLGIISVSSLISQTEKGNFMLGGDASTLINLDDGYQNFAISMNPNIGLFVKDNLVLGGRLPLMFAKSEEYSNLKYGLGPFVRYYLMPRENMGMFLGVLSGIAAATYMGGENATKLDIYSGIEAGTAHFLNESIALELALRYQYFNQGQYSMDERSNNSTISLNLGFQIYFNRD